MVCSSVLVLLMFVSVVCWIRCTSELFCPGFFVCHGKDVWIGMVAKNLKAARSRLYEVEIEGMEGRTLFDMMMTNGALKPPDTYNPSRIQRASLRS
jgi:hypothetical protein